MFCLVLFLNFSDDYERDLGPGSGSRFNGDYSGTGIEGRGTVQMGGSKISPHVFLLGRLR